MIATPEEVGRIAGDLGVLGKFVEVYCRHHHRDSAREAFTIAGMDVSATSLGKRKLCAECNRLLRHAVTKRARCPLEPKPSCRVCAVHCYAPEMRKGIREVMRFSGRHLILRGRIDYLLHFLERRPKQVTYRDGRTVRVE